MLTHAAIFHSDADAALYWLGRMLEAGEDPLYVARRLVRCASEDIGLADNTALPLVRYSMKNYIYNPEVLGFA